MSEEGHINSIISEISHVTVSLGMQGGSEDLTNNSNASKNESILNNHDKFYKDAEKYWANISPTVNGMLGGFSSISGVDINGSNKFLTEIFKMHNPPEKHCALDCGAGIGRVTKNLLIPLFDVVDIVEQDKKFSEAAKDFIGNHTNLGDIFNIGLQEFIPAPGKYDVVWCQWVLGHLTDEDLVAFFKRILLGLRKGGILVLKENVTTSNTLEIDETDSSATRSLAQFKSIIKKSGFRLIKLTKQTNFPRGLYPVYIMACKPAKSLL